MDDATREELVRDVTRHIWRDLWSDRPTVRPDDYVWSHQVGAAPVTLEQIVRDTVVYALGKLDAVTSERRPPRISTVRRYLHRLAGDADATGQPRRAEQLRVAARALSELDD